MDFLSFSIKNIYYNNVYIVQILKLFAYRYISIIYIYFQWTNICTLMIDRQESWQQIFTYLNMLKFTFNGNKKSFARIKYHTIGSEGIEKRVSVNSEWMVEEKKSKDATKKISYYSFANIDRRLSLFWPVLQIYRSIVTYTCTSKKSKIIFSSFWSQIRNTDFEKNVKYSNIQVFVFRNVSWISKYILNTLTQPYPI